MIVAVYKSSKKADTYLYIEKRDDFSPVPKSLLETFGKAKFVMLVPLTKRDLAIADKEKVMAEIRQKGFYLQLPPPEVDLLKEFKQNQAKK
ncbi:YcgL domain-containing protein [Psychrobium sp. MM17-31]|uniref:YcgL domain-containing protein n=1 Tax=Psychrobium sp. MM17-31 TaxID=2917758 RepID=UPI001EF71336|nr:YcgL domain-containing protein [Psychrobium sp. MM17-31]MCG7532162.1 YcgL domain-containing protein [Psychrobium sp. MM17-31]